MVGAPGPEPLLIDLLNSVLRPPRPIVEVRLLHPVLSPEHHEGRALIVDLVAIDDQGVRVQVEMQTSSHGHLRPRMLLGWAKLYGGQLSAGEGFAALRPVISLWFCPATRSPPRRPVGPSPSTAASRCASLSAARQSSAIWGARVHRRGVLDGRAQLTGDGLVPDPVGRRAATRMAPSGCAER